MFEGVQYFESCPGRGKFVKVYELQPDKRCPTDDIVVMPSFEVGSRVQFGDPEEYGKVTWIGCPTEGIEDCARVLAVRYKYIHSMLYFYQISIMFLSYFYHISIVFLSYFYCISIIFL